MRWKSVAPKQYNVDNLSSFVPIRQRWFKSKVPADFWGRARTFDGSSFLNFEMKYCVNSSTVNEFSNQTNHTTNKWFEWNGVLKYTIGNDSIHFWQSSIEVLIEHYSRHINGTCVPFGNFSGTRSIRNDQTYSKHLFSIVTFFPLLLMCIQVIPKVFIA